MATKTISVTKSWSNLATAVPLVAGKSYTVQATRGTGGIRLFEGAASPTIEPAGNYIDVGEFLPFALVYDGTVPWWIRSTDEGGGSITLVEVQ